MEKKKLRLRQETTEAVPKNMDFVTLYGVQEPLEALYPFFDCIVRRVPAYFSHGNLLK